jgi:hypothetical protein
VRAKPKLPFLFETAIQFANIPRGVANRPCVDRVVTSDDCAVDQPNRSVAHPAACGPSERERVDMTMSP